MSLRSTLSASFAALVLTLAGCGDGDDDDHMHQADASEDSSPGEDSSDADAAQLEPEVLLVPVSLEENDAFYGVTHASDGRIYTVGMVDVAADTVVDQAIVVARFSAAGTLDTEWGENGFATVNLAVGGDTGELARAIVVQSTGKVVVAATAEHDPLAEGTAADDTDIFLLRFDTDGELDGDFGSGGVIRFDINTGVEVVVNDAPRLAGGDMAYSIVRYADDRLLVHGATRAAGERSDLDWLLIRTSADGVPDEGFGEEGLFTLDIEQGNATAKTAILLADGSIVGSGYQNTASLESQQAVLYKVTSTGELDTEFGGGGVWHEIVLAAVTEAYSVVQQGTSFVTAGYGRDSSMDPTDWVSMRVTSAGMLDSSWGTNGVARFDVAGFGDNARSLASLPDGRIVLVGGGEATMGVKDAMMALLDVDGEPDAQMGTGGYQLVDLGGPADMLWAAATAPNGSSVAIVGLQGASSMDAAGDHDAALILISMP